MAQLLQAPIEGYEDAIVVPAITADNFELKHGLLTLVQNKQFFGHDKEDPHAHVLYFNKITSTLNFLNFFPPSKTTNLRNEITNFQQRFDESFSEAWDRFKDLLRACPHHGFLELHQLDTFYNTLNSKDQDSLNFAAGGNFLDKMPHECLAIIEIKSKIRYSRNNLVVAKVSTTTSTFGVSPDVAELKDMVKALLFDKKSQNQSLAPVKAVEESCVTCGGTHSYRNCPANDGNVYRDNIQEFISQASAVNFNQGPVYQPPVFQPLAYQASAYQAPAPQTQGVSKEDFLDYVKADNAVMKNMQTQGQNMQNQLTNLIDLITKFVNSNTASTSSSCTLPRNTIANPKSDLKAITTRSGVSYDGPQIPPPHSSLPKVVENKPEATKDTLNPTNSGNTKDVQPQAVQYEYPVLISKPVTSLISKPVIAPEKLSEMARTSLNEHCSAVLLKKLPKKLGDPCKFLILCFPRLSLPDLTPTYFDADPQVPLILGRSFLKTEKALIDVFQERDILLLEAFLNDDLSLPPPNQKNYMPEVLKELKICEAKSDKSSVDEPPVVELKDLPPHLEYAFLECDDKLPVIIAKDLSVEEKTALITVLKSYKRAIAWKLSDNKGINLEFCTHKILMEEDFEPTVQHQRRVNPKIHDVIKQEMIERLVGNQYYCFLDGFSGYFKIPIDPKDQEKTTFTCPYRTFSYRRMPFGLCNAPGTFQRCMMAIFQDMIEKTMKVFMDEFFVFGNSFQSCLSHLERMLKRCEDTNLCLNWEKSHFMVKEGIVLDHKISKQGIEVDKAKIDVISKLPLSKTVKGIRSFLGNAGFYCRFIKDFSKIARPTTRLLEKDSPFIFSQECVDAFQTLKRKLTEAHVLIAPNWDMPFELMCDANDFAIGAVLGQRQDKHYRPIHDASKTMTEE
nr:reverse transcriptase domain-containing protein [Tanacetum cinerariifolium]